MLSKEKKSLQTLYYSVSAHSLYPREDPSYVLHSLVREPLPGRVGEQPHQSAQVRGGAEGAAEIAADAAAAAVTAAAVAYVRPASIQHPLHRGGTFRQEVPEQPS